MKFHYHKTIIGSGKIFVVTLLWYLVATQNGGELVTFNIQPQRKLNLLLRECHFEKLIYFFFCDAAHSFPGDTRIICPLWIF